MADNSTEILFQSSRQKAAEQIWHRQGCPLFDVDRTTKKLGNVVSSKHVNESLSVQEWLIFLFHFHFVLFYVILLSLFTCPPPPPEMTLYSGTRTVIRRVVDSRPTCIFLSRNQPTNKSAAKLALWVQRPVNRTSHPRMNSTSKQNVISHRIQT